MFSLRASLTGLIARIALVVQRPVRGATDNVNMDPLGEFLPADHVSRYTLQAGPSGQSVAYMPGPPSSLPTTPDPVYIEQRSNGYGRLFSNGLENPRSGPRPCSESTLPAYEDVVPSAVAASEARRTSVSWNGRAVTGDVEMQLPVRSLNPFRADASLQVTHNERPPTYVEVEAAQPVAPRRRGCVRFGLLIGLAGAVAIAVTVVALKKAGSF